MQKIDISQTLKSENIIVRNNRKVQTWEVENLNPKWRKIVKIDSTVKYERRSYLEMNLILFIKLLSSNKRKIAHKNIEIILIKYENSK